MVLLPSDAHFATVSVIPHYTDLGLQLGDGRGLGLTPSIACFAERHLEVAISRAVKHNMLGKDNI